jgi:S-DNA-T family DNA segregation ATPase FtsK/SpoIIIE
MQTRRTRFLPKALAVELRRLPWRLLGTSIFGLALTCWLALISWSFADPSLNYAIKAQPRNWLGYRGASLADFLIEAFGLAAPLLLLPIAALGVQIATGYAPRHPRRRGLFWAASALTVPAFFSSFTAPQTWLLKTGLGGFVGDAVAARAVKIVPGLPPGLVWPCLALLFLFPGLWLLWKACGLRLADLAMAFQTGMAQMPASFQFEETAGAWAGSSPSRSRVTSWTRYFSPRNRALVPQSPREFWMTAPRGEPSLPASYASKAETGEPGGIRPAASAGAALGFANWGEDARSSRQESGRSSASRANGPKPGETSGEDLFQDVRIEPFFGPRTRRGDAGPSSEERGPVPPAGFRRFTQNVVTAASGGAQTLLERLAKKSEARAPLIYVREHEDAPAGDTRSFAPPAAPVSAGLPPVSLLTPPPKAQRARDAFGPALVQRADELMNVLGDFGVKGRIAGIHPGPVITLFELEPARGTKSSRVIGLADDIARSMSAVSARIAVIPGRDALGIELPNACRETVSLREILESPAFQATERALPLALGTSIGGDPIVADLARMPHLLVAGTEGSGKSAWIDAMILSLLFKLPQSQCNFILIDSQMLELAAYDGIPHLIAPVVTDAKKAVAALKWSVREMNARHERMSKLGVRNIAGYNAKAAAAQLRGGGEVRRAFSGVADGEDDSSPMPYLIVVVGEMAGLMTAAGKDVEFSVQRLSQMAHAAGIHLVMATERPSADVVTETIRANFPRRISFQAASKIDSRAVLGEQGAEQLLGAGDMLHMSEGGRIIRAHGPFVSGEEVECVTRYMKSGGSPAYREDIFDEMSGLGTGPAFGNRNAR